MDFAQELSEWPIERVKETLAGVSRDGVNAALDKASRNESLDTFDLSALMSPFALENLESIAHEAQRLTRWHFGSTIGLYAPLYLSNLCNADCAYCGFAAKSGNGRERNTLDFESIEKECIELSHRGFDNVLLVSGEAPGVVTADYLAKSVALARRFFSSVAVEVYPMSGQDYGRLFKEGLECVTLYAETYHKPTYEKVHKAGQKRNFDYRVNGLERAGENGVRKLNLGVLLGLFDWRIDGFWLALHARHLQKVCWQSAVGLSFPRLRHVPDGFEIPSPVSDVNLVQLMLALRLFLPEAGFNLSTREPAPFRDRLMHLGVTMMSAGSSTRPGGYAVFEEDGLAQFDIDDSRSPEQVKNAIIEAGYDPIWKDFDRAFDNV